MTNENQQYKKLLQTTVRQVFDSELSALGFQSSGDSSPYDFGFKLRYLKGGRFVEFSTSLFDTDLPYPFDVSISKNLLLLERPVPIGFVQQFKTGASVNIPELCADRWALGQFLEPPQLMELMSTLKRDLFSYCHGFLNGTDKEFSKIYRAFKQYEKRTRWHSRSKPAA